jgi:hypothetical protein
MCDFFDFIEDTFTVIGLIFIFLLIIGVALQKFHDK